MNAQHMQLIGKQATIIESNNKELIGKQGTITNETKNTITINDKKYLKNIITITIQNKIIKGNTIAKQPSERLKVKK